MAQGGFLALLHVVIIGVCVYSQPLLDCSLIVGRNVTVHSSVFNTTTISASQQYYYFHHNMSMQVLDAKLNVINSGTYELVANEGATKCYSVQTLGKGSNAFQQCATFSMSTDLQGMMGCIVYGYWCDQQCMVNQTYYKAWFTGYLLNNLSG